MSGEILQQVCDCVGRCFQVDPACLGENTSQDTIVEWDSVGQVQLILELESAFDVSFSLDEIVEIRSVADIVQILADRDRQ